jgi:hypothetical protein
MHTTGGTQKDFKGYTAENNLIKIVSWLALNKETKLSYQHGTTSPSYCLFLFF